MKRTFLKLYLCVVILYMLAITSAQAELLNTWKKTLGTEHFVWQEFRPSDNSMLLEERGYRLTAGLNKEWKQSLDQGEFSRIYQSQFLAYFGRMNYSGESFDENGNTAAVLTNTDYAGLNSVFSLGIRGLSVPAKSSMDLLASLGVNNWIRNIYDSVNAAGQGASGYFEYYLITDMQFALRLNHVGSYINWLRAGIRAPVFNYEYIALPSADFYLYPGRQLSYFADMSLNKRFLNMQKTDLIIYYEGYRFSPSNSVQVAEFLYQQPQSHLDSIGIRLEF
ncbi:MAG: hypothetical protein OEZ58_10065 [Gammaproteobacteria bacterium]|nr:hypothetical protein [Gammaproteobacteria bacterium]MDH5729325.1 hypothetical protein [Gammaproteobacteria bacterium]